jgi:CysZ protein
MSLAREARKLLYHLPRLLLVFVLTLIPEINLASPVIWLLFGAWTMAVQFVAYPTENRQRPFQETLDKLKSNRAAALAFGLCATGALMIPLLNFLLIPVAVAGGTVLWRTLEQSSDAGTAQP